MRTCAIIFILLSVFAPLRRGMGEDLEQPVTLTAADEVTLVSVPPLAAPPPPYLRVDNGRFAVPVGQPQLRRLGPCPGACEVNWYAGQLWFRAEMLAWGAKDTYLPALVTTGDPATPLADAGALDQPDTSILFGDDHFHDEIRLGGRLTAGWWFTPAQRSGIEAVYFGLGGQDVHFRADSNNVPVLAHPFTNVTNGQPESHLVAYPGVLAGETGVRVDSEVAGAEVLLRQAVWWTPQARIDVIGGYRHAHLFDRVLVNDFSVSLDATSGFDPDTTIERFDQFYTENDFHGGELGISTRWWRGCWSCQLVSKFAYGGVFTKNVVNGETVVTDFSGVDPVETAYDGGVYALPTNSGRFEIDDPTVLTEIGINLEYQIRYDMRIAIGYTLLYWDAVTRAPTLVQTSINPSQIPPDTLIGDALPVTLLDRTSFWAQGLNASFEYQF